MHTNKQSYTNHIDTTATHLFCTQTSPLTTNVDRFPYPGSLLSSNAVIDDDIDLLSCNSGAFPGLWTTKQTSKSRSLKQWWSLLSCMDQYGTLTYFVTNTCEVSTIPLCDITKPDYPEHFLTNKTAKSFVDICHCWCFYRHQKRLNFNHPLLCKWCLFFFAVHG